MNNSFLPFLMHATAFASAGLSSNIEIDVLLDAMVKAAQKIVKETHRLFLRRFDKSELEELSRIAIADSALRNGIHQSPQAGQESNDTTPGESWDNFVEELLSE